MYLHCPNCRLSVYNPSTVDAPERCPRCGMRLKRTPRRFLRQAFPEPWPPAEKREQ